MIGLAAVKRGYDFARDFYERTVRHQQLTDFCYCSSRNRRINFNLFNKNSKIFKDSGLPRYILGIYSSVYTINFKWTNNELELIDVELLCLQLLFVSGILLNARKLFKKLSNTNGINANINKTFTKTQKRNLRKLYAKPLYRGYTVNVVKVDNLGINNESSAVMFDAFIRYVPPAGLKILEILYPRADIISHHIKCILTNYYFMKKRKLNPVLFMLYLTKLFQNLMAILKEDLTVLSKLFSSVNLFVTEEERNNAAISLDNGVTEISSMISNELEDGTDEPAQETTNIQNMVSVSNDTTIRSLCKFVSRFSDEILVDSSLCEQFGDVTETLANNEELVQAYRMTMISAINRIMSRLPSVMNDERFRNNEKLFGTPVALAIKSYEDRKIFEDAVSSISVPDLFLSSAKHVVSKRQRDHYSDNIDNLKIHHFTYYLNSMLKRIRKEDNCPFLYQYALILLKRFLLDKLSNGILSEDNLVDRCERDLTSELDLLRLENDHFQSYYYNSDEASSVQSITKDTTMKYRKIFEISCLWLYKLQNAGFSAPPGVSIGKLITILIDFVKTELVNEFRNNRANYVSQRNSTEIFIKLIDFLIEKICTNDLFLEECIEFCQNHFERVDHVLIWEGVLNDEGVELLTLYNVNDFETA